MSVPVIKPGQAVDQRVKYPGWMKKFTERGNDNRAKTDGVARPFHLLGRTGAAPLSDPAYATATGRCRASVWPSTTTARPSTIANVSGTAPEKNAAAPSAIFFQKNRKRSNQKLRPTAWRH
jgi:hypothetical protein